MKNIIIGGAGFIGINLANRLLEQKEKVTIIDDLSRDGTDNNISWLEETHGKDSFKFIKLDISKEHKKLEEVMTGAENVYHFAAQVAVTTSVEDPRRDFEINALGTFNVLEAVRLSAPKAKLIYASTNKVYGEMNDVDVVEEESRYSYKGLDNGVSESQPLDFHSPYGCSKGSGDAYVLDYSRIYDLNTVVFRQSCIYGTRQFGVEDQGWVAWFIIALITGKPITIYGDGKQVRDVLHIDDLLDVYQKAFENMDKIKGQAFNIGGGVDNTISIWKDFGPILEEVSGKEIEVSYSDWRPGDQKVYISDITKARKLLLWEPEISPKEGIARLYKWVEENKSLFS